MSLTPKQMLTEAERIEVERRTNEINGIIKNSTRVMINRILISDDLKILKKRFDNIWYLFFIFIGLILDWYQRESSFGSWFNVGTFMWVLTSSLVGINWYIKIKVENKLKETYEKLFDLEMKWIAATNADSFWELSKFIVEFEFDDLDEKILKWKTKQRHNIITAVCEWEKAIDLIVYEERLIENEL